MTTRKKNASRRYSKKASNKVGRAMHEAKRGTLRSGRSGKKVKSREQAIAIGLSEARSEGAKVPSKKSSTRKASSRKASSRKASSRKPSSRNSSGRKQSTNGKSSTTRGASTGRKTNTRSGSKS